MPSFKQASIHSGVRIGIPAKADRITFKVLDFDSTSTGSLDFVDDFEEDAAAVIHNCVLLGLKSFIILRTTASCCDNKSGQTEF